MSWRDLGVIFRVDRLFDWAQSHAYVPTAIRLDDRIRVYVAFWDAAQRGRLGCIDVDAADPTRIIDVSRAPLLPDSEAPAFDCDGVTPLSVVRAGDAIRLYYAGWRRQPEERHRYTLFTGLATSADGRAFSRHASEPVIGPNSPECFVRTGGSVMADGALWRCWYAEQASSVEIGGKQVPSYNLMTMESPDGLSWPAQGRIAFRVQPGSIFGYGRSAIWKEGGRFRALLSVRRVDAGYRDIEYAESDDGVNWTSPGLDGMAFSSAMTCDGQREVCFPSLVFSGAEAIMFYNGDDFGREGLRAALWTP